MISSGHALRRRKAQSDFGLPLPCERALATVEFADTPLYSTGYGAPR